MTWTKAEQVIDRLDQIELLLENAKSSVGFDTPNIRRGCVIKALDSTFDLNSHLASWFKGPSEGVFYKYCRTLWETVIRVSAYADYSDSNKSDVLRRFDDCIVHINTMKAAAVELADK